MHKTLNQYVRNIVQEHPERWEDALVFATMLLRAQPMECLGGRSPYEVVTGLKPRMPASMVTGVPVEARTVNAYVEDLMEHLKGVYDTVQKVTAEAIAKDEHSLEGRIGYELEVGDAVLVKYPGNRDGPERFRQRTYDGIFVVKRKVSPSAFIVEDIVDKTMPISFRQPVNAERLIKLDMPELELRPGQPKRLEMREKETQPWNVYEIERFGVDGRVNLRLPGGDARWVDLTRCEYRWLA